MASLFLKLATYIHRYCTLLANRFIRTLINHNSFLVFRFWRVSTVVPDDASSTASSANKNSLKGARFEWSEWQMESNSGQSEIEVPGR